MNKRIITMLTTAVILTVNVLPGFAEKKEVTVLEPWDNITEQSKIERTSTASRNVSIDFYETNGKSFAYVACGHNAANQNQMLTVYDVTDPENVISIETREDIQTRIFNSQLAVGNGYLYVAQSQGNQGLYRYQIEEDGRLSENGVNISSYSRQPETVWIKENYMFHSVGGDGTSVKLSVYDISEPGSERLLGTMANGYGVYAPESEKISDSLYRLYFISRSGSDWRFCIVDAEFSEDGSVSFIERVRSNDGIPISNVSAVTDIEALGSNKIALVSSVNGNADNGQYARCIVDTSDMDSITSVSNIAPRALSVMDINDDYYIIGEQGGTAAVYSKSDYSEAKSFSGFNCGQIYDMAMYNGSLFIVGEGAVGIYKFYSHMSMDMSDISEINDGILNISATLDISGDSRVFVDVFGKRTDVTESVINGRLDCSIKADVPDGDYTAVISVECNDEQVLSDEKAFTVRKTYPLEIDLTGFSVGTSTVAVEAENTHRAATNAATLYLAVYNEDGSMSKVYEKAVPSLLQNETAAAEFSLFPAVQNGQVLKLFAADENGRLISDIKQTAQQSVNQKTDKIPVATAGAVNIFAEVDNRKIISMISGKASSQKENDIVLIVYKPEPRESEIDYINAFKSMNDGGFYCEYPLTSQEEGKQYRIAVYAYADEIMKGEKNFSYYSDTTINSALLAVKNATAETFESIAVSNTAQYKNVYNLNTEIYNTLISSDNRYKLAVGGEVAGKMYRDISELNSAFDNAVNKQKQIMDKDNEIMAALATVNSSAVDELPEILKEKEAILEIKYPQLFDELIKTAKENVYSLWLYNKSFAKKEDISKAIHDGTAVEYIKTVSYTALAGSNMLTKYADELGLTATDLNKYTSMSANVKSQVLKDFLKMPATTFDSIGQNFNAAVTGYRPSNSGGSSGGGSGGGGGSVMTPPSKDSQLKPVKQEDMIPSTQIDLEKNNKFKDVSIDDWYFEAVCALSEKKIVEGITEDEFCPDNSLTREELIKMIISAYNTVDYRAEAPFEDAEKSRWYYAYVASAYKLGITDGIGGNRFGIGEKITREDFAKIVYTAANILGTNIPAVESVSFADKEEISSYAAEAVASLSRMGAIAGFEDNTFRPKENVTRAMAAKVIYGILNYKEAAE